MTNLSKSLLWRTVTDCAITLILLVVALNFFKIFKHPVKRGFFCDDESLKYPYHSDTVNSTVLYILSLCMPITFVGIGEIVLFLFQRRQTATVPHRGYTRAFLKLHQNIIPFLSGFALQAIFVHTAKVILGRLRPHFFEVCQPYRQSDGSTCDNMKNHGLYIQDYDCNSRSGHLVSQEMLNSIHLSFPSGHSSYIFYGMSFVILYLERFCKTLRECRINAGLFMMVVQMFCALIAWCVAVSRVMDYKHHSSDVLVGIMLGTSVAIAVTLYVCQQLKSVNSCPEAVKSLNSEASSTTTFATTMPNTILVP